MEPDNNVITYKKSLIKSVIKDFRKIIIQYGLIYKKDVLKTLRRKLRSYGKAAIYKNENYNEYLQDVIDSLNKFKKIYLRKNKHHYHKTKYWGIETIKYLFNENENENHYELKLINY